jgi:peroxiredoxin
VSGEAQDDLLQRLDPDRAAGAASDPAAEPHAPRPPLSFSPRRYQWIAGVIALVVVVAFSIVQLTSHGTGTAGVTAGHAFAPFAAPLATSTLVGDANLHPPCTQADHDPRALNTCLLMRRGPLVLDFFVADSNECVKTVDAMQAIAARFRSAGIQFAAVAVRAGPTSTRALVRKHDWTIPVAYDRDGGVAESHGVVVCPLIELVRRGGVVARRLIGGHWDRPSALAAQVQALARR